MTLKTSLTSVTVDPALIIKLDDNKQRDCQIIASEIQREAAMFLSDGTPPPYNVFITPSDNAVVLRVTSAGGMASHVFRIYFSTMRRLMSDYNILIGAHGSALRHQLHARSEAIDMGRRALHNEGAQLILNQLAPDLTADLGTGRLLFTLLFCFMQR